MNYSVFFLHWRIFKHPELRLWTGFLSILIIFSLMACHKAPSLRGSSSVHTCGFLQFLLLPLWSTFFGSAVGLKQDWTFNFVWMTSLIGQHQGLSMLLFVLYHFGRQPPHSNSIATGQILSFNFCFKRGSAVIRITYFTIFLFNLFKKKSSFF